MEFSVGFGKQEITCFIPGIGMMGYGQPHNTVKEIATPLWARAMVVKHAEGSLLVFIHLELAFVSMATKTEIISLLEKHHPEWDLSEENLVVTAQHTHSAPGGYTHYPFYNFTIPGFQTKVFHTITRGAHEAVKEAFKALAPATLTLGEVTISPDKEVAFNRSLKAHLNNPDATPDHSSELAVERKMKGLLVKSPEGELRGMLNWFGVHCTSVSSYNQRIHHDNKGIAAELFEKNHPGTFAFFLQSSAGDVSPNFIWDKKLKRTRGKFSDQYESAAFNGEIQFRESEKISGTKEITGPVMGLHSFFDMTSVASAPSHGVAFFKGTLEGPGMPLILAPALSVVAKLVKTIRLIKDPKKHQDFYDKQGPKDVMLDHRDGSFLGLPLGFFKRLPPLPDPILEAFRTTAKNNALETLPWVPAVIPFQLIRLGNLLLVTIPGEITTMAARRLEDRIKPQVAPLGITEVITTSYANGYMGYVTTPEEYDLQSYEGGHSVYGRNSLGAVFAAADELISELKGNKVPKHILSAFNFPPEELARRSF